VRTWSKVVANMHEVIWEIFELNCVREEEGAIYIPLQTRCINNPPSHRRCKKMKLKVRVTSRLLSTEIELEKVISMGNRADFPVNIGAKQVVGARSSKKSQGIAIELHQPLLLLMLHVTRGGPQLSTSLCQFSSAQLPAALQSSWSKKGHLQTSKAPNLHSTKGSRLHRR
jgi:hypothetical protein